MITKLESTFEVGHPENTDVYVVLKVNYKNGSYAIFSKKEETCFMFQNKFDSEISNIHKGYSYKVIDMNIQVAECIRLALELVTKELSKS